MIRLPVQPHWMPHHGGTRSASDVRSVEYLGQNREVLGRSPDPGVNKSVRIQLLGPDITGRDSVLAAFRTVDKGDQVTSGD